jgi:alanyl-tRNA synthetase
MLGENLKNINKQLEQAKVKNIIQNKNKIIDDKFDKYIFRQQVLTDLPSKELRSIVDQGKKEIKSGIVMACCTYEGKIGVAIGVTDELVDKFDAVKLVKEAAEILGGKGGGGRKDFAQAGGINIEKI